MEEVARRLKVVDKVKMHEVSGFLKIISNKRVVIPRDQLEDTTNTILTLT